MRRNIGWWTLPLGLVLGGIVGAGTGMIVGDINLWMILGAGGGLVLGLATGAALQNRNAS
jgi:hypothetical protein